MTEAIRVGIIGDYDAKRASHAATNEALQHAAGALGISADIEWLPTPFLAKRAAEAVQHWDALCCAPGSPYVSLTGALAAIRLAREGDWPFIGTCGGFQHVVLEYARHVLGMTDATHAEYSPEAENPLIAPLACSLVGKTMPVKLKPASKTYRVYGKAETLEPFRCSFGLDFSRQQLLDEAGLRVVGVGQEGEARIVELPEHLFFIATLFVPQLASSPEHPHPLIMAFLKAARESRRVRHMISAP